MEKEEITTREILEFLQVNMVTKTEFEARFGIFDGRLTGLEYRFDNLECRFDKLEKRVDHIENCMVTKDYLDDKLADFAIKLSQKNR